MVVHEHTPQLVVTERVELIDYRRCGSVGLPRRWRAARLLTTPAAFRRVCAVADTPKASCREVTLEGVSPVS